MATIRRLNSSSTDHALGLILVREYTDATALEMEVDLDVIRPFIPDYDEFPGRYHPEGAFLVAEVEGQAAGGVGIAPVGEGQCEMNRLWVRPGFRALGLGRDLISASLSEAVRLGFRSMALEVLPSREKAIELYYRLGFVDCEPLHDFGFPMRAMVRELKPR